MRKVKPRSKVRFALVRAEEHGLLFQAIDSLPQSERDKIAAMLNFDMVGSLTTCASSTTETCPDSEPAQEAEAPPASADIEQLFLDYFESQGLETESDGVRRPVGLQAVHLQPASRRAACSPAPRRSRPQPRPRSTVARPGSPMTPATTSAATTPTATSTSRRSTR